MDAHVRPRQAVQGVEAEAGVLDQDGALDLRDSVLEAGLGLAHSGRKGVCKYQVGCPSALVARDFLEGTLDLKQVQGLALDLDGGFQDRLDFAEFVGVARYEVDEVSGCRR